VKLRDSMPRAQPYVYRIPVVCLPDRRSCLAAIPASHDGGTDLHGGASILVDETRTVRAYRRLCRFAAKLFTNAFETDELASDPTSFDWYANHSCEARSIPKSIMHTCTDFISYA
jgi:hypothetical protein